MAEFVEVGAAADLEEGEMARFDLAGNPVAVANVGGILYAFDDICSHRGCSLSEGELDDTSVICPCHGGGFDVTTGEVIQGPPTSPIRVYEARVEGDSLEVAV